MRAADSLAPPASPGSGGLALAGLRTVLAGAAILCLAAITLVYPGATRMHAQPWSIAYSNALLLPAFLLLVRAFDRQRPLLVPAAPWLALAYAMAGTVLISALMSPFRPVALLWSAPLLAGLATFLVVVDWLHAEPGKANERRERARVCLFSFLAAAALVSVVQWWRAIAGAPAIDFVAARNIWPLGHPNYTAGLALLLLPMAVQIVRRRRGRWQIAAAGGTLLALAMLFSSGSRGGFLGLGMLALAAWIAVPLSRRKKWQLAIAGAAAALIFGLGHPRTRAMFLPQPVDAPPNPSNVQRTAMLTAGWRMGRDRPLLGWGPGTTPLAFPAYRAELAGGADNVLQLHSLPVQLWAELGLAGLACALAFTVLFVRAAPQDPTSVIALAGYGVFALTDWQLDVPVFGAVIAVLAAFIVQPAPARGRSAGLVTGVFTLGCLTLLLGFARRDPTPPLNSRALALARDPASASQAVSLFNESLARNPDQEIAHFNLGWLQVVSNPAAAEQHFRAAVHLVPDKGGAYFGLGLARLNQGRSEAAAHAFALEALNDPLFLVSPWWREPAIAATRDATATELGRLIAITRPALAAGSWAAKELDLVAKYAGQLGHVPPGPEKSYRRERTGYPVLMRNLDVPPPTDLFDVREPANHPPFPLDELPPKGWLPSPLLLSLLDSPPVAGRK